MLSPFAGSLRLKPGLQTKQESYNTGDCFYELEVLQRDLGLLHTACVVDLKFEAGLELILIRTIWLFL